MTITIREQVLAALRNNPGLNSMKMAELIGMETQKNIRDGEHAAGRRADQLRRQVWPAPLQSDQLRHGFAPDTIPGVKQGKSKLIQRTDTNVICQEFRNSAAMKRVLMVWGG